MSIIADLLAAFSNCFMEMHATSKRMLNAYGGCDDDEEFNKIY